MTKIKPIIEKVYSELSYKGLVKSKSDFGNKIGVTSSYVSKLMSSNDVLPSSILEKLTEVFGIDKEWLSSNGDAGSMFGDHNDSKRKVPLIGEAAAGTDKAIEVSQNNFITDYIDVGDMLSDSEAAFIVYGNSMAPNYPSGCVLGIRHCKDTFIQPGEIYMIVTQSNRIFKRLFYNKDKSAVICYSDNSMTFETGPMKGEYFYPPFEVPLEEVLSIYDITGMIKRTRNTGTINRQK